MNDTEVDGRPSPAGARAAASRARGLRPLLRLLRYVAPRRTDATLTVLFGVLGFLLSFVYPWLIGSMVDLVTQPDLAPGALVRKHAQLMRLTELAAVTGVMHAVVVYGRGHFNLRLGNGIVTDLRRQLFGHLQRLSVGFYTKQRTRAIMARVLQDVEHATGIIYVGTSTGSSSWRTARSPRPDRTRSSCRAAAATRASCIPRLRSDGNRTLRLPDGCRRRVDRQTDACRRATAM